MSRGKGGTWARHFSVFFLSVSVTGKRKNLEGEWGGGYGGILRDTGVGCVGVPLGERKICPLLPREGGPHER